MLGLQAATLRVLRVEACDAALSHLSFRLSTGAIHGAASRLCMQVLAGVSPPTQAMLLRAMPQLLQVQPGQRPFGLPAACPGTHLMPAVTPDKVKEPQVRRSSGGRGWGLGACNGYAEQGGAELPLQFPPPTFPLLTVPACPLLSSPFLHCRTGPAAWRRL